MSTPDQPLTRKQLREIQRTGATPVIDPDAAAVVEDEPAADASAPTHPPVSAVEPSMWAPEVASVDAPGAADLSTSAPDPKPAVPGLIVSTPLGSPARAAEPFVAAVPVDDDEVDLDAAPLTRREARQQERIRTSSVPVISAEMAAAGAAASQAQAAADAVEDEGAAQVDADELEADEPEVSEADASSVDVPSDIDADADEAEAEAEVDTKAEADATADESDSSEPEFDADAVPAADAPAADEVAEDDNAKDDDAEASTPETAEPAPAILPEPVPVLYAGFGGNLLLEDPQFATPLPASFDQLIARGGSTTGSATATNALILSQTPTSAPLAGAVTATGEILVTGTLSLPEGLGSTGSDPRLSDGKEIDALLVDGGELPAASSPTPIAASAAISTIKGSGDIIKPPAPEKGSRLMFTLAITAGVLALALVGVLILGFISGALR